MNFALGYLGYRFLYRIADFLRHWYVKSIKIYSNFVLDQLSTLDYTIAWKITLKHLFEPLYGDYSFVGRILGFIFRFIRIVGGGALYLAIFAVAIILYLIWMLVPAYIILRIVSG